MTPPGIEPATFRFVAEHLKHCATAVPVLRTVESGFSCRDSLVYLVHILVTTQTTLREGAAEQKSPVGFHAFLFNVLG